MHKLIDKETLVGRTNRLEDNIVNGQTMPGTDLVAQDTGLLELYENAVSRFVQNLMNLANSYRTNSNPDNDDDQWTSRTNDAIQTTTPAKPPSRPAPPECEDLKIEYGRRKIMFSASIKEFVDIRTLQVFNDVLYVYDGFSLVSKKRGKEEVLLKRFGLDGFFVEPEGLWIYKENESNGRYHSRFVDLFNKGSQLKNLPFEISSDTQRNVKNTIIEVNANSIIVVNTKNGQIKTVNGGFHLGSVCSEEKMVVRDRKNGLLCLDHDFNEIWKIQFEKRCMADAFSGPQKFGDYIILNVGEIRKQPRGEFELNAYCMEDGSLVWQVILPTTPACSNVMGDKVYISVKDRLMVVDASTGKVLVDAPHQLGADSHHFLFPHKNFLIAGSEASAKVNVFSGDGQNLLQEISIPDPLTLRSTWLPIEFEDKLHMLLVNCNMLMREASSSLLELTPDESQPKQITPELPQRPPFYISVLTKKNGDHEHLVTVSHHDLDEIVLYGTIVLKEIVIEVSSQIELRKRDEDHNGTLHFVVDPEPLPKKVLDIAKEKLQVIAERIDLQTTRRGQTAGKDQKPFNVKIEIK